LRLNSFGFGTAALEIRSHERDVADEVEGVEADDPMKK
jgi:hypothetical protein